MSAEVRAPLGAVSIKRVVLLLVIAAVAVVAGLQLTKSSPAPALESKTIQGEAVSSGAQTALGKPYLVNFWATSCTACVAEMPDLIALQEEFGPKGYETFAVAMAYDRPDYLAEFVQERKLPFKVIHDTDNAWTRAYGNVAVTPTTFLVDAKGNISKRYVGPVKAEDLRGFIAQELR